MAKNVDKLVDEISKLSVLELSELVNTLQEKLGVSPIAAVAPTGQAAASEEETKEDASGGVQTVILKETGANKIAVIKALRLINPNLGLKEAKDMTEATPAEVLKEVKAEEAKDAEAKLKEAGATVELK